MSWLLSGEKSSTLTSNSKTRYIYVPKIVLSEITEVIKRLFLGIVR